MGNRVMDDETRKKLLGLLPFSVGSFAEFLPSEFSGVPEDFRPVFFVRCVPLDAARKFREAAKKGDDAIGSYVAALKAGALVGWRNLRDAVSGEEIPFSSDAIDLLSEALITSVFFRCWEYTVGPIEIEKTGLES